MYSYHSFVVINSAPNELDSITPCFLEYQWADELFKTIMYLVREQRIRLLPAWSESTFALILKPRARDLGALEGIASFASEYGVYWKLETVFHENQVQSDQRPSHTYILFLSTRIYVTIFPSFPFKVMTSLKTTLILQV